MKAPVLNSNRVVVPSDWWSSGWSEWMDFRQIPNYEGCGVYKVRLVNSEGFPVTIPRFIETDKDGILQICYSENIRRGIYRFLGATEGKKYLQIAKGSPCGKSWIQDVLKIKEDLENTVS